MSYARALCSGLLLVVAATIAQSLRADSIVLAWDSNSEPDIAGYTVYYGESTGSYINSTNLGLVTTNLVEGLTPGLTYFFAVTAYNTNGLESDFSNEVSYQVPTNSPLALLGLPLQLTFNKNTSAQLPFTVRGAGSGSNLILRVTTSNPLLLPTKRLFFQGTGTNRTLVASPVLNKWGKVKAVVTANDGGVIVTQAIALSVTASNNAPTLTAPAGFTTWKQTPVS